MAAHNRNFNKKNYKKSQFVAGFLASALVPMRFVLFWDIMRH
jgi:hypothetical protein